MYIDVCLIIVLCINLKKNEINPFSFVFFHRTLTYCIWKLMTGDEQQVTKSERVALPPPTKRRDHHLRKC